MSRRAARRTVAKRRRDSQRRRGDAGRTWPRMLATGLPGLLAVIAMIATWVSVSQTAAELNTAEQGQLTSRFNDATTNLGSKEPGIAFGGIAALQRILEDSPRDQPRVLSVLWAYVRAKTARPPCAATVETGETGGTGADQKSGRPPGKGSATEDDGGGSATREEPSPLPEAGPAACDSTGYADESGAAFARPSEEVEEIIDVLAHRPEDMDGRSQIDFRNTDLRNLAVSPYKVKESSQFYRSALRTPPEHLRLSYANLGHTDLRGAHLEGTDLRSTDLVAANLRGAHLAAANLRKAELRYADLCGADLSNADLTGALLDHADLAAANLSGATLDGIDAYHARGFMPERRDRPCRPWIEEFHWR
ncbi:pentapeptide repeat-containing protein [Streptomyces sp. 4.24]|uniref:pentapeptide repeat-containing protein n=1 Tax=Streptomyces tritrimontium TaxID=3406573 RepID=UPI003BB4E7D7